MKFVYCYLTSRWLDRLSPLVLSTLSYVLISLSSPSHFSPLVLFSPLLTLKVVRNILYISITSIKSTFCHTSTSQQLRRKELKALVYSIRQRLYSCIRGADIVIVKE